MQHLRQVQFESSSTDAVDNYIWICNQYVVAKIIKFENTCLPQFVKIQIEKQFKKRESYMNSSDARSILRPLGLMQLNNTYGSVNNR